MTVLQLDPPLWMSTPKGESLAIFAQFDWEHDIYWTCVNDKGECWTIPNNEVRFLKNWTFGRLR